MSNSIKLASATRTIVKGMLQGLTALMNSEDFTLEEFDAEIGMARMLIAKDIKKQADKAAKALKGAVVSFPVAEETEYTGNDPMLEETIALDEVSGDEEAVPARLAAKTKATKTKAPSLDD